MKSKITRAVLIILIAVTLLSLGGLTLVGCADNDEETQEKIITGITFDLRNAKTEFFVGDTFSTLGVGIVVHYSDGSQSLKLANGQDVQVTEPSLDTKGRKTVSVQYKGFTAEYYINVYVEGEKTLLGIVWNEKREYLVGAQFEFSPERKYTDGTTEPLGADEYTAIVPEMNTIGVKTVTLRYLEDSSYDTTFQIYCIPDVNWDTNKLDFGHDQNGSGATLELFVTERSARAEDGAYWGNSDQRVKGWLLVKNADGSYEMYQFDYYLALDVSSHFYPDDNAPEGVNAYLEGDPMVIEINGKKFIAWDAGHWHLIVIGWQ